MIADRRQLESVTCFAPATVANVGSAFDVLGFALENPGDTVVAKRVSRPGVRITSIEGDNGRLPREATKNTAGVSVLALLSRLEEIDPSRFEAAGVELSLSKGLPIGSGLGSSSASTVAAVVAVNALLESPLSRADLLPFAMEGERVACGSAHADNVAPCLLGGFALVRSYSPLDVVPLPTPAHLWVTVVSPHIEVRTEDARKILRRTVSLEAAVSQWGNVAALVAGIFTSDVPLIGRALEDKIIEPERGALIPCFDTVKRAAIAAGAAGCSISGSGPSVFALSGDENHANAIAERMLEAFQSGGIPATKHVSPVNRGGARILAQS